MRDGIQKSLKHGIQTKLVEETGLSKSFISLILRGKRAPSWHNSKILAGITGSDPVIWKELDLDRILEALEEWSGNNDKN